MHSFMNIIWHLHNRHSSTSSCQDRSICILCMEIPWIIINVHSCMQVLITYEDEGSEIYADITVMRWKFLHGISWNGDISTRITAIIYKRFLVEDEMKQERIKALYDICHAYWITTKVPNMKFIHVIADDGTVTQKVPYTEKGRVFLYSKTDRLVWEAKDGDIIQILSRMTAKDCSMNRVIWICAESMGGIC